MIDPIETYVLDDDELGALEDAGLTAILKGLAIPMTEDEIEVPYNFARNAPDCAWISEANVALALSQGYEYCRREGKVCYRRVPIGDKEYLLKKPPGQ